MLIGAAAVLAGCTACGFKGPLYLPQQNGAVVTHPAPPAASATPPAGQPSAAKKKKGNGPAR